MSSTPPALDNAFVNGKRSRFKLPTYKTWLTLAYLDPPVGAGRISDDPNVPKIEAIFDPAIEGVGASIESWAAAQARAA